MKFRIGQGIDAHAFCEGDHVVLGGLKIPHERGLAAFSDGDVVLHALCDALLGAAALGDLGRHFPTGEEAWRGADSRELLSRVLARVSKLGWTVANADLTIVCQGPRIGPHVSAMREAIAAALDTGVESVSLKATSTDGLGFAGRGEGIAALAVVLIQAD